MTFKMYKNKSVLFSAAIFTLAAAVTSAVLLFAGTAVTSAAGRILGDADGNGTITINDVTCIQKTAAELPVGEGYSKLSADVDGSGAVDITDATLVQRWLAEMETPYNIGEQIETPTEKPTQPVTTQPATTQPATDEEGWGRIIFRP